MVLVITMVLSLLTAYRIRKLNVDPPTPTHLSCAHNNLYTNQSDICLVEIDKVWSRQNLWDCAIECKPILYVLNQ